jgi:heme A synthase
MNGMNWYMRWFVVLCLVVIVLGAMAVGMLAAIGESPFDPPSNFGCVAQMSATVVPSATGSDERLPVQVHRWTLLREQRNQNSADEWRLKCKYGYSRVIGDPRPTQTPSPTNVP